jgi:hypothetical protein
MSAFEAVARAIEALANLGARIMDHRRRARREDEHRKQAEANAKAWAALQAKRARKRAP